MIDKDKLYAEIIEKVSQCIKNILDETFTTYPWDKVTNYISKVQNELFIAIIPDSDQPINPPAEWMNTNNLDDKKYVVYSLIKENISEDKQYFDDIKKSLQLVGLNYSKSFIKEKKEHLLFIPKKQNQLNMKMFNGLNYLYHVCPHYATEKIKEIGFIPKAKNALFNYDPRIHFFFPNTPIEEMKMIRQQLDDNNKSKGNDHSYDIIKLKIPENITFYKDLDYLFGLYTNENIDPKYIEEIKSIDGMSNEDYLNWQFKLMFPNI